MMFQPFTMPWKLGKAKQTNDKKCCMNKNSLKNTSTDWSLSAT